MKTIHGIIHGLHDPEIGKLRYIGQVATSIPGHTPGALKRGTTKDAGEASRVNAGVVPPVVGTYHKRAWKSVLLPAEYVEWEITDSAGPYSGGRISNLPLGVVLYQ